MGFAVPIGLSVVRVMGEELDPITVRLPPATMVWVIRCWNWMVFPAAPGPEALKLYQLLFPPMERTVGAFCRVKETDPDPGLNVPALFHCAPFIVIVYVPAFRTPPRFTFSAALMAMLAARVTVAVPAIVRLLNVVADWMEPAPVNVVVLAPRLNVAMFQLPATVTCSPPVAVTTPAPSRLPTVTLNPFSDSVPAETVIALVACNAVARLPPLARVRMLNGSVPIPLVVMVGFAELSVMVELPAFRVKLALDEFHAPAMPCEKVDASQVPCVMVSSVATVHPPVEVTAVPAVPLLITSVEKASPPTLAGVLELSTTVLAAALKTEGVKLAPAVMISLPVAVSVPPPATEPPTPSAAPFVLHVPAVSVSDKPTFAAPAAPDACR